MQTILYLTFLNEDIRPGYKLKIHSQLKGFFELGFTPYLIIVSNNGIKKYGYLNGKEVELCTHGFYTHRKKVERNVRDEFLLFFQWIKIVKKEIDIVSPDCVYIRRIVPIMPNFINLLSDLRKRGIKIIYEYPTWPWDSEVKKNPSKNFKTYLFFFMDKIQINRLLSKVDLITYMGIYKGNSDKFIAINNCGDAERITIPAFPKRRTNEIHMIGVAHVSYLHGYDIIIDAMEKYYNMHPKQKVFFDIVGSVPISLNLEKEVKNKGLSKYVKFWGIQTGKELDHLYASADLGINALRFSEEVYQKRGVTTLKTVEYTFKGLPQISSAPFALSGGKTDTPEFLYVVRESLDINDIVNFLNNLHIDKNEIRQYAIKNMSWKDTFRPVLSRLEKI